MAGSSPAKDVFLSYSRKKELESFVKKLKHDLEARGISVWLDVEDIPPGGDRYAAIGSALYNSKCLVAVLSNCYITSKYCKSELYPADESNKPIIPVLYETINYQVSDKAMGVKYILGGLDQLHFVPSLDDYEFSMEKLMDALKQHCTVQECIPSSVNEKTSVEEPDLPNKMAGLTVSDPPPQQGGQGPSAPPLLVQPPPKYNDIYPQQYPPPTTAPLAYPPSGPPYQSQQYPPPPQYPPVPQPVDYHGYPPPANYPPHPPPTQYPQYPPPPPSSYPSHPPPAPPPTVPSKSATPPQQYQSHNTSGNPFRPGMRLEAVDRRFPYYVCVATVGDVRDEKVQIHFDGWSQEYDYWCTYDMVELHPVGWCAKHDYELQKPRNTPFTNWDRYLTDNNLKGCYPSMFNEAQNAPPGSLNFRVGMKVEAVDRKYPTLTCVATIKDISGRKDLLIHFDDWSDDYDYWCKPSTTDIHPPMWCSKKRKDVNKPKDFQGSFKWNEYLADPNRNPAPAHLFTKKQLK